MPAPLTPAPPPPHSAAPTRWWHTNPVRIAAVVAVPLLGALDERVGFVALVAALVLLWRGNPWPKGGKILATIAAMALLGAVIPDQPRSGTGTAAPSGKDARPAGAFPAFGTPTAAAPPTARAEKMPDFLGERLDTAFSRSRKHGYEVTYHDASGDRRDVSSRSLWKVCFQRPAPGTVLAGSDVEFSAVRTAEPCPAREGEPVPWPKMPDVVWKTWPTARAAVVALGVPDQRVHAEAAYANDLLPDAGEYDTWRVCRQDPAEGAEMREDAWVTLSLSSPENGCPDSDRGTAAYLPDQDGDGDPDYHDPYPHDRNRDTAFPHGRPGGGSGGGSGGSGHSGGSSGGDSDHHGWNPCRHTRWC